MGKNKVTRKIELDEFIEEIYFDYKENKDVKYLFFLGAGCSKSSGIPLASELALEWYEKLSKQPYKYKNFNDKYELNGTEEKNKTKVKSLYFEIFETLFHDPIGKQKEIQSLISDKLPALGYYTLAKLMQYSAFNTVITTNFDDLIQDALIYNGEKRAKVITHEELAFFIERSETPLICKIHGDAHFQPYNSTEETQKLSDNLSSKLETLFDNVRLVFIGYGGDDKSILEFLTSCKNIAQVYWLNDKEPKSVKLESWWNELSSKVFINEYDFDEIMSKMKSKFNIESPNFDEFIKKLKSNYNKSIKDETEELEDKDNKDILDYFLLGNNMYYENVYDQAIKYYKKVIEINPQFIDVYDNMGLVYIKMEEYEKVIDAYQKAIELNSENTSAYYNMGKAYGMLEDYDKAIECYQKIIDLNPKYAEAYNAIGVAFGKMEEYKEAIKNFKKTIELNPESPSGYGNMGFAYFTLKKYDRAIESYEKAIGFNSKNASDYYYMGYSYAKLEEHDKAIELYQKAIILNPESTSIYFSFGCSYSKIKEYDKAIENYQKAIESDSENACAYTNLFEVLIINNKPIDAVIEEKYNKYYSEDKKSFMKYEMLKILQQISLNKSYSIDEWKEKYKDFSLEGWSFIELEKWIETNHGDVKKKLEDALVIFKMHNNLEND